MRISNLKPPDELYVAIGKADLIVSRIRHRRIGRVLGGVHNFPLRCSRNGLFCS